MLLLAHKIHGRVGPRRGNARRSGSWKSARGTRIGDRKVGSVRTPPGRVEPTAAGPRPPTRSPLGSPWDWPGDTSDCTGAPVLRTASSASAQEPRSAIQARRHLHGDDGSLHGAARDPHRALRCRHEAARSTLEALRKEHSPMGERAGLPASPPRFTCVWRCRTHRRQHAEGTSGAPHRAVINARTSARGSRHCSGGAGWAYDDVRGRAGDVLCSAARIGAASASCARRRRDGRVARDRPRPGGRTGARDDLVRNGDDMIGTASGVAGAIPARSAPATASRARRAQDRHSRQHHAHSSGVAGVSHSVGRRAGARWLGRTRERSGRRKCCHHTLW